MVPNLKKYLVLIAIIMITCCGFFTHASAQVATQNPVPVVDSKFSTGLSDACAGKDCYSLFSGFADALGGKFGAVQGADSLGALVNALVALGIGVGGVLAVVLLMYEGYRYMRTDNAPELSTIKANSLNIVMGFLLLLCVFVVLRTINPDLLNLTPRIDAATLDTIADRSSDTDFQNNLEELGGSDVPINISDYSSPAFIMYLYHQQGEGGAPSILWAAAKGYTSIPSTTPFIKGSAGKINRNMANNVNASDMQKIIGTSEVTPSNFLKYWIKKVKAAEESKSTIPSDIDTAVSRAATDTGVTLLIMRTICRIESRCNRPAADKSNGQGYYGLFQISVDVFENYGKGGTILDYYSNAYAGGKYAGYNMKRYNSQKSKITE